MKKILRFNMIFVLLIILNGCILINNNGSNEISNIKGKSVGGNESMSTMNLIINNNKYTVNLEDNNTVKELLKLLPLEIEMNDLNSNEKYYYLDSELQINSEKVNSIKAGDIMLYGNNCLVIFYDDFNTSYSYTRIGKIVDTTNLKDDLGNNNIKVSINN